MRTGTRLCGRIPRFRPLSVTSASKMSLRQYRSRSTFRRKSIQSPFRATSNKLDDFLDKLNFQVDVTKFFHPDQPSIADLAPNTAAATPQAAYHKHQDRTCKRFMKIMPLHQELNSQMYQLDFDASNLRSSSNEIDMPSGEIFECLAKEY